MALNKKQQKLKDEYSFLNISEEEFTKRKKFLTVKNTKHSYALKKQITRQKQQKTQVLKSNQVEWHT